MHRVGRWKMARDVLGRHASWDSTGAFWQPSSACSTAGIEVVTIHDAHTSDFQRAAAFHFNRQKYHLTGHNARLHTPQ
jgi:hypothetical protein